MLTRLNTSEVKAFLRYAAKIETSFLIPIQQYIKLTCQDGIATLTKTNGNYVMGDIECVGDNFTTCLDERILIAACSANPEWIEVTDEVKINTLSHPPVDVAAFGKFPEISGEKTIMETAPIVAAKAFTTKLNSQYDVVHIVDGCIYASTSHNMYAYEVEGMPDMQLTKEAIGAISQHKTLSHYRAGNYDFFESEFVTYGFVQQTYSTPGFKAMVAKMTVPASYVMPRSELLSFCQIVTQISLPAQDTCDLTVTDGLATMSFKSAKANNEATAEVEQFAPVPQFSFDARVAVTALSALSDEIMSVSMPNPTAFVVKEGKLTVILIGCLNLQKS